MSYTKHTWADGEVITAAKLNNIEEGIEGAQDYMPAPSAFIVNITTHEGDSKTYLDKTWREIYDAFLTGPVYIVQLGTESERVTDNEEAPGPYTWTQSAYYNNTVDSVYIDNYSYDGLYGVAIAGSLAFGAFSENDYPSSGSSDYILD